MLYFYRVRAVNSAGKGMWSASSLVVSTATAAAGTHGPPMGLTTTLGSVANNDADQIVLAWNTPTPPASGTTISPVIRYEIQFVQRDSSTVTNENEADDLAALKAAEDDGSAAILIPTPPTNITYTHTGLPGGTRYVYRVRAINSAGEGPWTVPNEAAADSTVARNPDKPILTATAVGDTEILLEWNVPNGNGTPITGYDIRQWNPADAGAWGVTNLLDADNNDSVDLGVDPKRTVYTVDKLPAGVTYYFRIRAEPQPNDTPGSTSGLDDEGWSATNTTDAASATTAAGVPGAPTLANPDKATEHGRR